MPEKMLKCNHCQQSVPESLWDHETGMHDGDCTNEAYEKYLEEEGGD